MTDEFIYVSTGTPHPAGYVALQMYLEAIKDWRSIVKDRRFYAGCSCECCSTKKRPGLDVKCSCGIH